MSYFKKQSVYSNSRCLVGVTQTEHGVGATHFCLAFSIYHSQILKKKTVVISMGHSAAFEALSLRCLGQIKTEYFLEGVLVVNDCTQERLSRLFLTDYDTLIIDFGVYSSLAETLFSSCNLRILIGSLVEWKEPAYATFLERSDFLSDEQCFFLALFASEDQKRRFRRKYGIRIHSVPFEPDPFLILRDNLSFYDLLANGRQ